MTAPAYWARLARVRIVADMSSEGTEFSSVPTSIDALDRDGRLSPEVVKAFTDTGARLVIARKPPAEAARPGRYELGPNTQWFTYSLR